MPQQHINTKYRYIYYSLYSAILQMLCNHFLANAEMLKFATKFFSTNEHSFFSSIFPNFSYNIIAYFFCIIF